MATIRPIYRYLGEVNGPGRSESCFLQNFMDHPMIDVDSVS